MVRLKMRRRTWDRFAYWAPGAALLVVCFFALLLSAAVMTVRPDELPSAPATPVAAPTNPSPVPTAEPARDTDLQLYDRIAERVAEGEPYHRVAVEEQRARNFPVNPGIAVRLPTLATLSAALGERGMMALAVLLGLATLLAWWERLRDEPGGGDYRIFALLLLVIGAATGFKPQYLALHEVWAGMLLALSLGLHRPGKWGWAWLAAAAAVAVRELAVPFVLLMGTMALWRGHVREALAWAALVALFALGLLAHLAAVAPLISEADRPSPGWLAMRGLGGWTGNIVLSGPLHMLPGWVAAPLSLLPLVGWAGWRSALGATGFLLCLGYGVLFMIAGRDNNFYWALVVMPVWFIGLAFVPCAVGSLLESLRKL